MQNVYRLAGHTVRIESLYPMVHDLCAAYRADGAAEYHIVTTPADIAFEREKSAQENLAEGLPIQEYPAEYLETLAVYRRLATLLVQDDTLLMHGSVVAVDGQAYLFTAKSGTGKSTHTRLWMQQFGSRAVMVNGDKPLLHITGTGVIVYGTPWDGKEHLSTNIACPLKAICILTRSKGNHISPISKKEALPMLCQQVYRPSAPAPLAKTLVLVNRLSVPLYRMGCNMDLDAALVAYYGMNPGEKGSAFPFGKH